MTRDWYKTLTWLMWLAFPITALEYWRVWDQLPLRMAVHFDANWQPNGYTSREGALMLGLGIMGFMLVVGTVAALVAHALKPRAAAWVLLAIVYGTLAVCWYGNHSIIRFNLNPQATHSSFVVRPLCHSERSEESAAGWRAEEERIPRSARNDKAERKVVGHVGSNFCAAFVTGGGYVRRDLQHSGDLDLCWPGSHGHSFPDERDGQALSQGWSA